MDSPGSGSASLSHVCLLISSMSILEYKSSRSATVLIIDASSSSSMASGFKFAQSQLTLVACLRCSFSCASMSAPASCCAATRISSAISFFKSANVKASASPCSSSGMPSALPACLNCSSCLIAFANLSSSSGKICSLISLHVTAQMICCLPASPARLPKLTFRSRVSRALMPTRPSWISLEKPGLPSSISTPFADPISNGNPRLPSSFSSKPCMSKASTSPKPAQWPSAVGFRCLFSSWRCCKVASTMATFCSSEKSVASIVALE
mmetsp:Transcript_63037/g.112007  ORF Transcript_63037/g.112007 Transcript_63037/m.112007 type:complete len:266 (+) Transcript_63037:145-942(+)